MSRVALFKCRLASDACRSSALFPLALRCLHHSPKAHGP
jgi:hypothetical protein